MALKEIKENHAYPIKQHTLYDTLIRKKLIIPHHWASDDGKYTRSGYKINPDKMWLYEKYEQFIKENERSEEHSILENKSYKLDVIALIVACLALVISFFALFK